MGKGKRNYRLTKPPQFEAQVWRDELGRQFRVSNTRHGVSVHVQLMESKNHADEHLQSEVAAFLINHLPRIMADVLNHVAECSEETHAMEFEE